MAAGLGFKTFTTGEVLTAADTNGYLMQGVLVFASAAARDAAITSPQEGQCCYLKDTDAVLTYSGAAWVGFDDSNAIQNTIMDAKGDLIGATAADTPARLAVGTNGQVLTADSTAATGLAWATASSGLSAATQAEMESASSTSVATTPGRQQYHPSSAKGWANFNGTSTYTINASYNVSSVSSIGTAQYRVNWDVDFSSANYAFTINCDKLATDAPTTATMIVCNTFTVAAGYMDFALMCVNGTRTESGKVVVTAFGDQ